MLDIDFGDLIDFFGEDPLPKSILDTRTIAF